MIRRYLFVLAFFLTLALFMVFGAWLFLMPRRWAIKGLQAHGWATLWLAQVICGTKFEIRGREHLPAGAALIAAKHQSAWDTFALPALVADPAMVLKAELLRLPIYGWYVRKFAMIPVERSRHAVALRRMNEAAARAARDGRQIVIFPEGTRRQPGAPPAYKPGIVSLYESLGLPCVPVALNSGLYWPGRSFELRPGTIIIEFLPPIPPGLERAQFKAQLQEQIETASARLLEAGSSGVSAPAAVSKTAA